MQTLSAFLATRTDLELHNQSAPENPYTDKDAWSKGAKHYYCTLKSVGRGPAKEFHTYFSMGSAHKHAPTLPGVLDCLASDAAGYENARTFEEWANEYGYDPDSRKAERLYNIIREQAKELEQFLGADSYHTLLWETERE